MKPVASGSVAGAVAPDPFAHSRPAPEGETRRPRILLLLDRPDWAFDFSARQIAARLADRFDFRFLYVEEQLPFTPGDYDLVYVFFWGERYQRRFNPEVARVVKEISSHRWELEPKYGLVTPEAMARKYLRDAATVVTTSRRLYQQFAPYCPRIFHCPNGFDPSLFQRRQDRRGQLTVGWAGNPRDAQKGIEEILRPACAGRYRLLEAASSVPHAEMGDFYNQLDVFLVGSRSEGEPLTLIEAMACGCFPVCTDVGIVPELVQHGVNGLIVERTVTAFREALSWCEANLAQVRRQGAENARRLRETRDWAVVVEKWARMFDEARSPGSEAPPTATIPIRASSDRSRPGWAGPPVPLVAPPQLVETPPGPDPELLRVLAQERPAPLLVLGSGGEEDAGDLSDGPGVTASVPPWEPVEIPSRLAEHSQKFGGILLLGLAEGTRPEREELLAACFRALRPGGRVYLTAPNSVRWPGNLLERLTGGARVRGANDSHLGTLLRQSGFCQARIYTSGTATWPERLWLLPVRLWFRLRGRPAPKTAGRYLLMSAKRPVSQL